MTMTERGYEPLSPVDAALRATDPAPALLADPRVGSALDELGRRMLADDTATWGGREKRPARRRRPAVAAGLTALSLAVVGGGVAAATQLTAHTGFFGWDGADHSEWLNSGAPDFVDTARELTSAIRFAPGDTAENYWWIFLQKNDDGTYTQFSTTGVKSVIADAASCSWQRAWLRAHDAGDVAGVDTASTAIHAAARSPELRSNNNARYTEHLIDAADAGDTAPLQASLRMACPTPKPATP